MDLYMVCLKREKRKKDIPESVRVCPNYRYLLLVMFVSLKYGAF